MSYPGRSVLEVIDLVEDHVAMGSGAIVRHRHKELAQIPGNDLVLHEVLATYTSRLHGHSDKPKNRRRRKAQRAARRRSRR